MECACTVDVDIDDYCERHFCSIPTALVEHKCDECSRTIRKGEEYIIECTEYDYVRTIHVSCEDCYAIRQVFFSNGWYYGNVREQFLDFIRDVDGDISVSCINQLPKKAKEWGIGSNTRLLGRVC